MTSTITNLRRRARMARRLFALPLLAAEEILVGGQAVLEGVMMRVPGAYGIAVHAPDGTLRYKYASLAQKRKGSFLTWPLVRGAYVLLSSLALGTKALNFSAEVALEEEKKREAAEKTAQGGDDAAPAPAKKQGEWMIWLTLAVSLALGIGLFFYVPLLLTKWAAAHAAVFRERIPFNLLDGGIRLVMFLGYVAVISLMRDIRRVFQYHGAEHKVIHAWERRLPLAVESARPMSTLHPRCGTAFLFFVVLVSIVLFSFLRLDVPHWQLFLMRLPLLPVIAGISYELIRLSARNQGAFWAKILMAPGLATQKLTTKEPDDAMLGAAVSALEKALATSEGRLDPQPL